MTEAILEYGNKKYGKPIGYVLLIKVLAIVSLMNKNSIPALSVLTIAPSGHFKSYTSKDIERIFKKNVLYLGSDFTMHNLVRRKKEIDGKTMTINDLTLLFASKKQIAKERLCNGLAELLSEGKYIYGDFRTESNSQEKIDVLEAKTNLIANITETSFRENKNKQFVSNTFIERLFSFFYEISIDGQKSFNKERDKRIKLRFKYKLEPKIKKVKIPKSLEDDIIELAQSYMENTCSKSFNRASDKVRAILISNVLLNSRDRITKEDIDITKELVNFSIDTNSNYHKILFLHNKGMNPKEISKRVGISIKSVYYHLKECNKIKSGGNIYE